MSIEGRIIKKQVKALQEIKALSSETKDDKDAPSDEEVLAKIYAIVHEALKTIVV